MEANGHFKDFSADDGFPTNAHGGIIDCRFVEVIVAERPRGRSGTPRVSRYLHRSDRGNNNRSQSPGSDAKPPSDYRGCCRARTLKAVPRTYACTSNSATIHAHTCIYKSPALHGNLYIIRICVYRVGLNRGTKKMFGQCHRTTRATPREDVRSLLTAPIVGNEALVLRSCMRLVRG